MLNREERGMMKYFSLWGKGILSPVIPFTLWCVSQRERERDRLTRRDGEESERETGGERGRNRKERSTHQ